MRIQLCFTNIFNTSNQTGLNALLSFTYGSWIYPYVTHQWS